MSSISPTPRTVTDRRNAAKAARKSLRRYSDLMSVDPSETVTVEQLHTARLNALLWAEAVIQRALSYETNGRLGDAAATPRRIAGQQNTRRSTRLSQRVDDEIYPDDEDGGS